MHIGETELTIIM